MRKSWGYRQDQLSSTHPVYCEMPDLEAVEVNFDGITYAKGASVIKQLVAYVGLDSFLTGLRAYFQRHAWGNATFDDLLTELESASGRELRKFAAQWLETAQVNTLRPLIEIGAGRHATPAWWCSRRRRPDYPTLRTHRIGVGLYDLQGDRLVRRDLLEIDVTGERTEIPALAGVPAADVLLLNDDDLTLHQAAPGRALDGHRGPAHRRPRLVAGPGAVLERRLGHAARRRAGRPRLRDAGLRRPARPRPTST